MSAPAKGTALQDALLQKLRDCAQACDPAVRPQPEPLYPKPVEYGRQITVDRSQYINTAAVMRLNQLYREECAIQNEQEKHGLTRIYDPLTPKPNLDLDCGDYLKAVEQGPKLNTDDYGVLLKGQRALFEQDVDRFAKSSGLVLRARTQPGTHPNPCAEQVLEAYFERYGVPSLVDCFTLSRALRIRRQGLQAFFEQKRLLTKAVENAKNRVGMKAFLRNLQERGLLEEYMQVEREKDAAQMEIDEMD